jgi:hypothetical protein
LPACPGQSVWPQRRIFLRLEAERQPLLIIQLMKFPEGRIVPGTGR